MLFTDWANIVEEIIWLGLQIFSMNKCFLEPQYQFAQSDGNWPFVTPINRLGQYCGADDGTLTSNCHWLVIELATN